MPFQQDFTGIGWRWLSWEMERVWWKKGYVNVAVLAPLISRRAKVS
jgi:hypothetical protein